MKNFFLIPIGAFITLIVIVTLLLKSSQEENQAYKDFMGTEVIYKEDTLVIVDYSVFYQTYTFDTGVKMNMDFVEQLPKLPK